MTEWGVMTKPKRERDSENPKTARLMLRLTPDHLTALREEAERRGQSVADLARSILIASVPPKESKRDA